VPAVRRSGDDFDRALQAESCRLASCRAFTVSEAERCLREKGAAGDAEWVGAELVGGVAAGGSDDGDLGAGRDAASGGGRRVCVQAAGACVVVVRGGRASRSSCRRRNPRARQAHARAKVERAFGVKTGVGWHSMVVLRGQALLRLSAIRAAACSVWRRLRVKLRVFDPS